MYKKMDKQIEVCLYNGKLNNKNNKIVIYAPTLINLKNIALSDKKTLHIRIHA